jgi:hypothetical protein
VSTPTNVLYFRPRKPHVLAEDSRRAPRESTRSPRPGATITSLQERRMERWFSDEVERRHDLARHMRLVRGARYTFGTDPDGNAA